MKKKKYLMYIRGKVIKEIEYPKVDLQRLQGILKKVESEYGGIVSRKQLASICNVSEKGGGFSHTIHALKLYGIVNKEAQSEFRITDLGKGLVAGDKSKAFEAFRKIQIFRDLHSRYENKLPKKSVIIDTISERYALEKSRARTIASRYLNNEKFLNSLQGNLFVVDTYQAKESPHPQNLGASKNLDQIKKIIYLEANLRAGNKKTSDVIDELLQIESLPDISLKNVLEVFKLSSEENQEKKEMLSKILENLVNSYS